MKVETGSYARVFKVTLGLLLAALVGAGAWAYYVGQKVCWSNMAEVGQFGDAMAPAGLVLTALSLVLAAVSVQLQRADIAAQLEEMKDSTRFQGRREVFETFDRLQERLHAHRRACRDLVDERRKAVRGIDMQDEWVANLRQQHLRNANEFYDRVLKEMNEHQSKLTIEEAKYAASADSEELERHKKRREEAFQEIVRWHAESRVEFLRLQNPGTELRGPDWPESAEDAEREE